MPNKKNHTVTDALAHGTVTSSEFFSHIVNNVGVGGLGNNVNEDMMMKTHKHCPYNIKQSKTVSSAKLLQ